MTGHNPADMVGSIAGTLTTVAFLPQVIKTWRSRSTEDISLLMFLIFTVGVGFWLIYGLILGSWPVIVSNALTLILAGFVLTMKIRDLCRKALARRRAPEGRDRC